MGEHVESPDRLDAGVATGGEDHSATFVPGSGMERRGVAGGEGAGGNDLACGRTCARLYVPIKREEAESYIAQGWVAKIIGDRWHGAYGYAWREL